jgi:IclR family acetate operon transcriptional repressor
MRPNGSGHSDPYTVKSLSNAISILELLAESDPEKGLNVTELAAASGMSKSAVFAIMQTFLGRGLVIDDGNGQGRSYRLGGALVRLGDRAKQQLPLRQVAGPVMHQLADEVGLPVRAAVLQDRRAITVSHVDAPERVQVSLRMSPRELLHNSALGKAILSGLTDDEARQLLLPSEMTRFTPRTITDVDRFINHLDKVRRIGYAVDDEESAEGIFCIAAPVFDTTLQCIGAISVTSLKHRASSVRYEDLGLRVVSAARDISLRLGWRPPVTRH